MIWVGWHFLPEDGCLVHVRPKVKICRGHVTESLDAEKLSICKYGYHASRRAIDALKYSPGPIVCRVELLGRVVEQTDRAVAQSRRVIAICDASTVLHKFACRVAEAVLGALDDGDERSWNAIHTKREWLAGRATEADLSAARDAAWDAACDAAWDAAWAAACDAARVAARDAACDAARAASWDEMNLLLESMLADEMEIAI